MQAGYIEQYLYVYTIQTILAHQISSNNMSKLILVGIIFGCKLIHVKLLIIICPKRDNHGC